MLAAGLAVPVPAGGGELKLPPPIEALLPPPPQPSDNLQLDLPPEIVALLRQVQQLLPPPPGSQPEPAAPAQPEPKNVGPPPFWGLGAWVDLYDYGHPQSVPPEPMVAEMAARGVRTLYVQTARWNTPGDIRHPATLGELVERAHDKGIKVVTWYLPGFANLDLDIQRSIAALQFRTPRGDRVDGFAPDIEDRSAVGGSRDAFNAGIVAYGQRLRAAVPEDTVLAAIVPDAKNNTRAPGRWAGFPWAEIARDYDVVMPMSYWSVAKPLRNCTARQLDAGAYMREVVALTTQLMGRERPMHPIGGIADCVTPQEVQAYTAVLAESGAVGGGLYDYTTNVINPGREALWAAQTAIR